MDRVPGSDNPVGILTKPARDVKDFTKKCAVLSGDKKKSLQKCGYDGDFGRATQSGVNFGSRIPEEM